MFLQINIKTNDLFVHILRIVNIYNYDLYRNNKWNNNNKK